MSDEPQAAPFTFKPAPTRKAAPEAPKTEAPKRARKAPTAVDPRASKDPGAKKPRKRRAKQTTDVLVLKACLKHLRTLDPADALRTVETLRVLFK